MLPLELLVVLIAFSGNILLGLFTFLKNPKSHTNRLFVTFVFSLSAYILINYFALHQKNDADTFFWVKNVMTIAVVINLFFFLLTYSFPENRLIMKKVVII